MIPLFASLAVLLLFGTPIAIALGAATLATVLIAGDLPLSLVIQRLVLGVDSFLLVAVPLFILAGQIMNVGGITEKIFDFSSKVVGHIPGGFGHANVVGSVFMSGMSGSAIADAGGLGAVEIKYMRTAKYPDSFTLGITSASAIIGPIIPPSIPMIVYGAVANVSVGRLFLGGVVPGTLMALALMVMAYVIAVRYSFPVHPRASLRAIGVSAWRVLPPALAPLIIIGGIATGWFTPTEAGAVAVIYSTALVIFYGNLRLREFPKILIDTAVMSGTVLFIMATASAFAVILSFESFDLLVRSALLSISAPPWAILLLVMAMLLVLGTVMEAMAILVLLVPVLAPVMVALGVDLVHFGVIVVLNLMIGLSTPPLGLVLFVISAVSNVKPETVMRIVLPWLIPLVFTLILCTLVPGIVLWLPNALMGSG